jgi:hypothetical protein
MTLRFHLGTHSVPDRGVRREDIMAAREKVWLARTDDQAYSRFGDTIDGGFDARREQRPSALWRYGYRRAPWWIKHRLSTVVFRPYLDAKKDLSLEDGGRYEYDMSRGTIILLWGSSYGAPAKRHCIYVDFGKHYGEAIRDYLAA